MTNGELVSRFVNDINALNLDSHVSRRYIWSMLFQRAETYTAQRWEEKTLFIEEELYTYIDCIEMERVDSVTCECLGLEFPRCDILMKSKHQIPGLFSSKYGPSILQVSNLDRTITFKRTTISSLNRKKKRVFAHVKEHLYYVLDGYIFIPDYPVEVISAIVLSLRPDLIDDVFHCNSGAPCKSFWDYDFICPKKIRELVASQSLSEILGSHVRIPIDENPDTDSNIKSDKAL